ncbi:MAG: hypothetical protein E6902_12665 [Paeniclostridium sordellii]|uniref:Uncharacterized protein n=1 Tax=Paeniclostridium hominis TaxID=2764329 RepID=A0ABR7K6F2_9FIRM|nr:MULTISPECIES: hypothetical protein [Paeniclostridium]MBC6004666.1 hypothetical protein [Paeniclostridium hominis]MDU1540453.1 hypothetical protein [Paeniclostridium sordellii]
MKTKYKSLIKISLICILFLIFTTPNSIFKEKFYVNKVDSSEAIYKKYLNMSEDFEGVSIINNNSDKNKLMKDEYAYVIFKNHDGKYYNNVTIKEENNGIIITYQEANENDNYKNETYNSKVDKMMLLRIKSNEEISSLRLLNH